MATKTKTPQQRTKDIEKLFKGQEEVELQFVQPTILVEVTHSEKNMGRTMAATIQESDLALLVEVIGISKDEVHGYRSFLHIHFCEPATDEPTDEPEPEDLDIDDPNYNPYQEKWDREEAWADDYEDDLKIAAANNKKEAS